MLKLYRSEFPKPKIFSSPAIKKQMEELHQFYSLPRKKRKTLSIKPNLIFSRDKEFQSTFSKLSSNKCAYCETSIVNSRIEIDHFRPKAEAEDINGKLSPDHYYWLTFEWDNLIPSCQICNMNKGRAFPVKGKRISYGQNTLQENALLLNPFEDEFHPHLKLSPSGEIESLTEKGEITIRVLGLNRSILVESRKKNIELADYLLGSYFAYGDRKILNQIIIRLGSVQEYAGSTRSYMLRQLEEAISLDLDRETTKLAKELHEKLTIRWNYIPIRIEGLVRSKNSSTDLEIFKRLDIGNNYIQRVEIKNFKSIAELKLDLSSPTKHKWKVLVGDNGSGKTSILQAIMIALMDENQYKENEITPERILKRGQDSGHIRLFTTKENLPIEVNFDSKKIRKNSEFLSNISTHVFSFGSVRLLGKQTKPSSKVIRNKYVNNLFDPFVPLNNPANLTEVLSTDTTDKFLSILRTLLNIKNSESLKLHNKKLLVMKGHEFLSIEELSDGYKSVLVLAFNIIENFHKQINDISNAEGIVLIDELGTHLHPKWEKKIVGSLKEVFPNFQFIVTTHSPFIVQSCIPEEVQSLETDVHLGNMSSIEDIAEGVMLVKNPQWSEKRMLMFEAAKDYFTLLHKLKNPKDPELQNLKAKLDMLKIPFEENPSYAALLEAEAKSAGIV